MAIVTAGDIIRPMALRVSSPILVGRGEELRVLLGALDPAAGGHAVTVLVDGEAGIGKTRLVREFAEDARRSGATVLQGGCIQLGRDEGLPFAPVTEALRGLYRERGEAGMRGMLDSSTAELASLIPELSRSPDEPLSPYHRPDWAQTRLFEGMLILLSRLAAIGPTVLVIDDLHWADRSTRDLFAFLARNLVHEPVVLVGTYRSDELHRRHPLRPWTSELERLGVIRLPLGRLDLGGVRDQIEAITAQPADTGLVEAIERRSGGNPFFVEELLASGGDADLPESLRDVLLARVGTLSDDAQELLGVASVAGPVVDHDVLLAVAGLDESTASPRLREVVAAHLLMPTSDGTRTAYAFRHALLQEAIYDDLLPRDRRRIHQEYARILESLPEPAGAARATHLAAIAHHAEAAHDLSRALEAWLGAARAAFNVHLVPESAHAYGRCLDLWDAVDPDDRPAGVELVDVLYDASYALGGAGEVAKARDLVQRAVDLEGGADPERVAFLLERLGRTQWLAGDLVSATATLERAAALIEGREPSDAAARVIGGLAGLLMLGGSTSRAIATGHRAVELARQVGSREAEAQALNTLGASLADRGRCEEGIEAGRRGLALSIELDRPDEIHRGYACLSTALSECGRNEEAYEVAMEGDGWAIAQGRRFQRAFLRGNAASELFAMGRWREAAELTDLDLRGIEGVAVLNMALTAAPLAIHTGRLDDARDLLGPARARIRILRDAQFTGPISVALAELALAEGRIGDASAAIAEGLALMAETEDVRFHGQLMALMVRVSALEAASARARRDDAAREAAMASARSSLDELRRLVASSAAASDTARRDVAASLATAEAEHLDLCGSPSAAGWAHAAEAWDATPRPFRAAMCRLREAEAWLTSGARAEGVAALEASHRAALEIGATVLADDAERLASLARVTLAASIAGAPEGPSGEAQTAEALGPDAGPAFDLTERELQILPLLAAGYSNRQIGETLFISPSTAGVHVSRILGKMGVASRVEAAAVAVRHGLA
jgi:DNA-binding CsgD family transcriptional regulator